MSSAAAAPARAPAPARTTPWRITAIALIAAVCVPLLTGCTTGKSAQNSVVGVTEGADAFRAALATLKTATPHSMKGYSRDRFPHWSSQGAGCDTRDVVLKRDGTGVRVSGECKITSGRWYSPYDGKTFTDPQQIDIDHTVPLANAWRSGADTWTDARRKEFANDLTRPQLLSVSASANRAKGDQDPSQWRPANRGYWCEYAQRWIAVKRYWQLSVTEKERSKLAEMLETCTWPSNAVPTSSTTPAV